MSTTMEKRQWQREEAREIERRQVAGLVAFLRTGSEDGGVPLMVSRKVATLATCLSTTVFQRAEKAGLLRKLRVRGNVRYRPQDLRAWLCRECPEMFKGDWS